MTILLVLATANACAPPRTAAGVVVCVGALNLIAAVLMKRGPFGEAERGT